MIALVGLPQHLFSSEGSLYQDSIATLVENIISDPAKARVFYSISKNLKNNNPQLALSYAYRALKLVENSNDSILQGLVNNRIGLIYLSLGCYDLAEEFILKNLLIQQNRCDKRREADAYINLGKIFKKQENYKTAKSYFLKSYKLYTQAGLGRNRGALFNNLGVIYKYEDQLDSSIYYFKLSLEQNKKNGNINGLADNFVNLSILHQKTNDNLLAEEFLNKALKIQISTNNVFGELTSLLQLAELSNRQEYYSKADSVLNIVQKRARTTGFKLIESSAFFQLYKLSKQLGDSLGALKYLEYNRAIEDSISKSKSFLKIKRLNKELERVKDDNRYLEIMKVNNLNVALLEKDKQQFVLLSTGLSTLIILAGLLLFFFAKERRTSNLITSQSIKLERQKNLISKNNVDLLITISDLKDAKREEEALLGLIVHDLKAPIGQIQSLIELLTEEMKPETLKKEDVRVYSKSMNLSFTRIDELISSIINAHKTATNPNLKTHLNSIMNNIIERSKFQARSKQIEIHSSLGEDFILENKDPEKLKRIIENLISNAIKFSKSSSEIRIKTELINEGVIIEIGDQGPGFSKSGRLSLSDVIGDNYSVPTGSEKSDKIGLKVVKSFSDDLGIRVIINSEKKAGTTLQLYLNN